MRNYNGIGFFSVFFLVLFVLKLTGPLESLSWWWVTAPIWGPCLYIIALLLVVGIVGIWTGYWTREARARRRTTKEIDIYRRLFRRY